MFYLKFLVYFDKPPIKTNFVCARLSLKTRRSNTFRIIYLWQMLGNEQQMGDIEGWQNYFQPLQASFYLHLFYLGMQAKYFRGLLYIFLILLVSGPPHLSLTFLIRKFLSWNSTDLNSLACLPAWSTRSKVKDVENETKNLIAFKNPLCMTSFYPSLFIYHD